MHGRLRQRFRTTAFGAFGALGVCALVIASGCRREGAPASAPAAPVAAVAAPGAGTAMLKGLENGDRACYVVLTSAAGEQSLPGDFELCPGGGQDASALIGQRVTYTTRRDRVLAAACEGNPDCGKTDEVDLVTALRPAAR